MLRSTLHILNRYLLPIAFAVYFVISVVTKTADVNNLNTVLTVYITFLFLSRHYVIFRNVIRTEDENDHRSLKYSLLLSGANTILVLFTRFLGTAFYELIKRGETSFADFLIDQTVREYWFIFTVSLGFLYLFIKIDLIYSMICSDINE